ncbi:MAG TPA: hypothetical protein VGX37_05970 [Allosphingosinicella sp.]|jgi:hypothetical protein|nr:hypothetical protein [Allosphingosinicella sp.]
MRKVIYGGAVSLDGFLAGPGEAIDWLALERGFGGDQRRELPRCRRDADGA